MILCVLIHACIVQLKHQVKRYRQVWSTRALAIHKIHNEWLAATYIVQDSDKTTWNKKMKPKDKTKLYRQDDGNQYN